MTDPAAHGELASLAGALRAHVARARGRGRRRSLSAGPLGAPGNDAGAGAGPGAGPDRVRPTALEAVTPGPAPAAPSDLPAQDPATAALARSAPDLAALERAVAGCEACGLCRTRTRTVFADGNPRARVMFVGEAPGADEDRQGVPFVGRAGQLLSDIIAKGMGLSRESDVYVANVLKCRPPENRDPSPEEKRLCTPFLERQIELVDPEVLIPLGRHASQHLLGVEAPMGRLRGRVHRLGGRAVVPTYHPAYLLRDPSRKPEAWQDIQLAMGELGLEIPASGRSRRPRPE
jgi:uracil-DNA glycosylase family 4